MLQVQMLAPLPIDAIKEFLEQVEVVLVPEVNFQGQFARLLQAELGIKVLSMTKYTGMPFSRLEILRQIHALNGLAEPVLS